MIRRLERSAPARSSTTSAVGASSATATRASRNAPATVSTGEGPAGSALNRAAIGVDRNGAAAILKRVLGLRGAEAARQQEHGDSETLLHCCDLLSREFPQSYYAAIASPNVIQITFKL